MKLKRFIVSMLAICLLLSLLPLGSAFATEIGSHKSAPAAVTKQKAGETVTRAEWISGLVSVFEMSVAEENAPDNYYSDLTGEESYYRDILVATSFGVIDVEAGLPFRPDEPTTREFAARTLNACLGIQLNEGAAYTFNEATSVSYPNDIQVAIERGWFALQNGNFLPNQAITSAESENMLADASEILKYLKIDENYNSIYTYKVGVIEIPDGTMISLDADDILRIENCPVSLKPGDLFVVYFGGIPCAYSAKEVSKEANATVVKTASVADDLVFEDIDAQGSAELEFTQFVPEEGTEVVYINEITKEEFTDPVLAEKSVQDAVALSASSVSGVKRSIFVKTTLKLSNTISASVSFTIKDPQVSFKFNLKDMVAELILSGKYEASIKAKADFADAVATKELRLYFGGFAGVGGLELSMVYDLSGGGTAVYSGSYSVGVSYTKGEGAALLRDFKTDSFSLELEAQFKAGFQVSFGINDIPNDIISGYVYFEVGPCGKIKRVQYTDHEAPKVCLHTAMYLYSEVGYKAAFKFKNLKQEFGAKVELWTDKNSPIRVVHHYEDGIEVPECTRSNPEFTNFFTPFGSRWGGGVRGMSGTYGLDANGKPVQIYTYDLDADGNAIITGYKGNASALVIPETLDGHTVVSIGESAFKGLTQIYSVILPDTLTSIESSAFYGCTNLCQITLPDGLRKLSGLSFAHCTSLTYVYIPKTITNCTTDMYSSGFNVYEGGPFYKCTSLKSVRFADGITSIPNNLFYGCNGLESIIIPETVTKVGEYAFHLCSRLSNVTLPSNLEELGPFSFGRCTSLRSISIPKTLKSSPSSATAEGLNAYYGGPFYRCSSLASVNLETGMSYIPANLFYACTGLESVKIPDTVVEIRENAFRGCTALKTVDFPNSLTSIGATAFFGDESLTRIVLPKNLKTLTGHAFTNCTSLESVFIPKSIQTCTYEEYQSGLNFIKGGPFYNCSKLNNVEFEDGVTKILPNLFFGCTGLKEIVIPETVTEIGGNAFNLSVNLRKITFPKSLETISGHAFYKCRSLETITVPDSVTGMGTYCFAFCDRLKSVTLPSTRINIMAHMFEGCAALNDVVLPDSVKTVQESAFKDCSTLSNLKWSSSILEISDNAFENSGLQILELPNSVSIIGKQAFVNCDSLTKAIVPDRVTSFGEKVFYDCDKLDTVQLGTGITSIPASTFENCDVMESITLPYTISSIGKNAFKDCVKLTEITILQNVSNISDNAFSYPSILTIYGVSGSYAETYANQIGAKFVSISKPIKNIKLAESAITLSKGSSYKLTAVFDPVDFTDAVDWKSSNTNVVTVNKVGMIKAVAGGSATISVVAGNLKATCTVTVLQPVTSISLNKTNLSLDAGSTYTLTATVNPSNANNKAVTWSSSDTSVATVTQEGVVTALKKGAAIITCAAQDGSGVTKTCTVTVPNNVIMVTNVKDLQSAHPYEVNCSDVWVYQSPGAGSLKVAFSQDTSIEAGSDYIYLYDSEGNQIGKYTGTELAGQTVTVPGYMVKIKLVSDGSYCEYGFTVANVEAVSLDHTHSLTAVAKIDATCTSDGTEAYWKCSVCGMMFSDAQGKNVIKAPAAIKATGHKWDAGKVTTQPTETAEGVKTFTCTVCGQTRTESIPKLNPTPTTPPVTSFSDVPADAYFAEPVSWAVNHEPQITNGTGDGKFSPKDECQRCQIVTFLWRAMGCPEPTSTVNPFVDVKPSDYFYKAVLWAVEKGITNGMDATHFGPNLTCTRGQAVTFLWRAEGKPSPKTQRSEFTDVQNPNDYFYAPVLWAVENGITNGTGNGLFSPNMICLREQIVTFLYRDLA